MSNTEKQFWFIVGSQFLYGEEVLEIIEKRAMEMAEKISECPLIPVKLVYKGTVKTEEAATSFIKEANSTTAAWA